MWAELRRIKIIPYRVRRPRLERQGRWCRNFNLRPGTTVDQAQPAVGRPHDLLNGCFTSQDAATLLADRTAAEVGQIPFTRRRLDQFSVSSLQIGRAHV